MTLDAEEVEILARVANQSHEVETLRTELLNANKNINDLTLRLLGDEETPGNVMAPVTSTPCRVTIAPKVQLLSPFLIPQNQSLQIQLLKLLRLRQRTSPC